MKALMNENLFDFDKTIAKDLFLKYTYPWEIIPDLHYFIIELSKTLDKDKFRALKDNVWVSKSANISDTAFIVGPSIIDENAEIRHNAYIRENSIIGKNCVVGNSTEIKNSILFNDSKAEHFNFIGDSILGFGVHLGAGAILSNRKTNKTNVTVNVGTKKIETSQRKLGSFLGDNSEAGCNSVLNPGTVIGKNSQIYPLINVRGFIPENSILKDAKTVVTKK